LNENEFADKIQNLRSKLYRTAYLYLGSEAAALDAVDETVYKGLTSLKGLRQPEYFSTWMMRILINECKTELRRRNHTAAFEELPETASEQFDALPIREAILKLPSELKEPVILRYFSGFTTAETALALKIPQGTAATRLRRALKLLRLELSEEEVINEQKQ
jgi:RNA polymerase sigma factor (sigma-70 family)